LTALEKYEDEEKLPTGLLGVIGRFLKRLGGSLIELDDAIDDLIEGLAGCC